MTRQAIYLDHNAVGPASAGGAAAHAGRSILVGNPSSVHAQGRALRALIDKARAQVAASCRRRARPGGVHRFGDRSHHPGDHRRREGIQRRCHRGLRRRACRGAEGGRSDRVAGRRSASMPAASIKVEEIASALAAAARWHAAAGGLHLGQQRDRGGSARRPHRSAGRPDPHYLFVDAVQGFGKLGLEFASRAPDMMAVSGHKIGGPTGIGALLVKGHADQSCD
jgi:cysteine desulfurase